MKPVSDKIASFSCTSLKALFHDNLVLIVDTTVHCFFITNKLHLGVISKLCSFFSEHNVLRMGGGAGNSQIQLFVRCPLYIQATYVYIQCP